MKKTAFAGRGHNEIKGQTLIDFENRAALICGISGQDGALLARLLLRKGYAVFGTSRDAVGHSFSNLRTLGIYDDVHLLSMNPLDFRSVLVALEESAADEVYFLSGQSSVGLSFKEPADTIQSIVMGTLNMLEACKMVGSDIRQYYAGSIESFGDTGRDHITEDHPFDPQSPYAVAKASSCWLVNNYRQAYGQFAASGILSNHESALRPQRYVTQKIIQSVKRISSGNQKQLELGRLDIQRDWGWAAEFVEAMWLTLQQDTSDNFLISTGETYSLENFVEIAFNLAGLNWRDYVIHSPNLMRPSDIASSFTNPGKAKRILNWKAKSKMANVVLKMFEGDLN